MLKKLTLVALAAVMALALTAPPAQAGVGGCRFNCGGGLQSVKTTPAVKAQKPSFLDSLSWILPQDLIAAGKSLFDRGGKGGEKQGGSGIEGVGGCRFNCGGGGL